MSEISAGLLAPSDWQRVKAILIDAAGLSGNERIRLVEAQFPDEPELCVKLTSLLEALNKLAHTLDPERTATDTTRLAETKSTEELIRVGATYGHYRVRQRIGAGGEGEVFLAEDVLLGRRVALKTVAGRWRDSATARQRLLREA